MAHPDGHIPMGTLLKGGSTKCPPVGSFPIVRTNSYGRMMISAQMNTHERLIRNATSRTDSYISPTSLQQMEYNRKMEKWRPGYNELHRKAVSDKILAKLIATAPYQCDDRLGKHIDRFRTNRNKNPRFKPSWLEAYGHGKGMAVHEDLLRKAKPRIDSGPPAKAMKFKAFLRSCAFTQGGFRRVDPKSQRRIRLPPVSDHPPGVEPEPTQRETEQITSQLESKYATMLFETQMLNATNDDVRLLYAKSNKCDVEERYNRLVESSQLALTKPLELTVEPPTRARLC